jgi:hypothetical protein
MALPETNQGFLGNIETVNTNVTSENVPSAFLGKEALAPTYEVASLQRNIPNVPTIDVSGSGDLYSGSNDLSYIVDLTTDPDIIKKRREEEQGIRRRLDPDVDPLFSTDPGVDITASGISANVPDFRIEGTKPYIGTSGVDTSTDITDRIVRFGEAVELGSRAIDNPFKVNYEDIFKSEIKDTVKEGGKEAASDYIKGLFESSATQTYRNVANPFASSYQAATVPNPATSSYQPSLVTPSSTSSFASTAGKVAGAAGAAFSAYNAYDAFKQGDTLGGLTNAAATAAFFIPGMQPVAIALTALNFVSGFRKGKPKPGMGGSEIMYNKDTGQLAHSSTWAYNGFNPSQAKQHTDQAIKFVNNYMKEFNVKLNPEKFPQGQSNWQYLSRIDVSPYKNGSQSAGELIERWMSSGAFTGNPSYYDANAGERRFFTSQEEYETAVNRFSNKVFS